MCHPAVYIGMAVAGTAMSMMGNYYQGQTTAKLAKYQAEMAGISAGETKEAGRAATRLQRIRTAKAVGAQRAAMGGSGIDVNTGSALDTQVESAQLGEMDALMIRQNYEREARAKFADANMYTASAKAAKRAAMLGMSSSFLTGASGVADKYYRYNESRQPTMDRKTTSMYQNYYNRRRRPDWNYGR
jgi:hypothetical protein